MLTIAEVSGLIAAAVMINAVRYMRSVLPVARVLSWTLTAGAALLTLSSVLAPLGLYDEIVPGDSKLVEFEYVKDPGPWGRVTMPRPNSQFTRHCELGVIINCPGQYQGVYMNETSPGVYQSQETDENSTVNLTIPENYTAMFRSATSDQGNTVSGLFDIQYRRWAFDQWGIMNKGQPYVKGNSRDIQSLITQDKILLTEGLIVDMRDNPGIGFRNHTIPVALEHGGTWSEDITWIEPVTQCADTNLSIQLTAVNSVEDVYNNYTYAIIDRGAFLGLDATVLESPPWLDNQTLDLFGRAHKAARMHNVLVANSLNISLPLGGRRSLLPPIAQNNPDSADPYMYSYLSFDQILTGKLSGLGGAAPDMSPLFFGNTSVIPFVNHYPNGLHKLLALNYSAVTQVCRGYYAIRDIDNDLRANNITYPAVQCGYVLGAPTQPLDNNISASSYTGVDIQHRNLYVCATGVRASVKTVDFHYNGTAGQFSNLAVSRIADKVYPDENSKPLWAAEHSRDKVMRFDPLWGMVDSRYETYDGFYSMRAEKLWIPTSPHLVDNFGESEGFDALAGASGFTRRLGNLYNRALVYGADYSGQYDFTLLERFRGLSLNATKAAQIPNLIYADGLAAGLVGTKTSISTKYVEWPASLAVDNTVRGFPRAQVIEFKRVIRYDLRYAIPGFVVLAILLIAVVWACGILLSSPSIIRTMQNMYNQTSTGRLATNLLRPGRSDPKEPSGEWVRGDGGLILSFGRILAKHKDYFCTSFEDPVRDKPAANGDAASVVREGDTVITATPKRDGGNLSAQLVGSGGTLVTPAPGVIVLEVELDSLAAEEAYRSLSELILA
ncbi:hypothetical protein H2200_004508 [Cladophialophora chaetospira]|uniref:Uncharacterized protein n=1 Tax=Cladophialophora chaetospira TaxID=386627 RepID=A0AA38XDX0_9EURO|nr:hypothetical protein H2200_004508 [Cladophialophora chaetospira]